MTELARSADGAASYRMTGLARSADGAASYRLDVELGAFCRRGLRPPMGHSEIGGRSRRYTIHVLVRPNS